MVWGSIACWAHFFQRQRVLKRNDCELRRMTRDDALQVLSWRNQARIRANMYSDHIIELAEHQLWLEQALSNDRDHYLIFEWCGRSAGFVSITGMNTYQQRATWAFYLGETDLPKGSGVAMEYLALEHAFETLSLRKLTCEVFKFNVSVIRLHTRFGFQQEAIYKSHALKNGLFCDVVGLAMFRDDWFANKGRMYALGFDL